MTNNYDVLAMGGGHNGLVAAAYLAKAGKKVLVLERKAEPGGGVATCGINTPGYWHDAHSSVHIMIQGHPLIRQHELGFQSKVRPKDQYGMPQAAAGSGKLSESLIRCIEHYGGEVRCNSEVTKILTSGGRATGVRLSSGEEISARDGVIGAIHPHRLRAFVDGVPERVLDRAERTTLAAFSIMVSHYDLRQQAQFYAGEEVGHAIMLEYMSSNTLSEMLDDFDTLRRGRISERVLIAGGDV